MTGEQVLQPKLFDSVVFQSDDPEQNIKAGMTGVLMELGADQTWGVVELDDDAIERSGRYTVSVALTHLVVLSEVNASSVEAA